MLFEEEYKTIAVESTGIYKDRGSKFIGLAFPVANEIEIKKILSKIKSEHPKANHHCYAFRIGAGKTNFRFSDDREPSGSAGKPIFGVIQSNDLTDILIVVARYFGGTLLGVPGLINAYRSAAQDALKNASIISKVVMERYELKFEYEVLSLVLEIVKMAKAVVLNQRLEEDCTISIELPRIAADELISKIRNHYQLIKKVEITVL